MSNEFIDALHAALPLCRYSNRSDFIRDAIVEKLERKGIKVDPAIVAAPPRVGKKLKTKPRQLISGKGDYPEPRFSSPELNDRTAPEAKRVNSHPKVVQVNLDTDDTVG